MPPRIPLKNDEHRGADTQHAKPPRPAKEQHRRENDGHGAHRGGDQPMRVLELTPFSIFGKKVP